MTEHTIERLTVHHAGLQSSFTGPPRFRSWQNLHQGRGWGDIAYHYIIGIDGTVYEGRDPAYEPDTGTDYDTTGHLGIVVEGNFEIDEPTQAQLDALVQLLAWASIDTVSRHRRSADIATTPARCALAATSIPTSTPATCSETWRTASGFDPYSIVAWSGRTISHHRGRLIKLKT